MSYSLNSTLLLTILLAIGLFFFLRASSKDRTTIVEISSSQQPVKVLNGLCEWLNLRGWKQTGGDFEQRILIFKGQVVSSKFLAIFLGFLGGFGSCEDDISTTVVRSLLEALRKKNKPIARRIVNNNVELSE